MDTGIRRRPRRGTTGGSVIEDHLDEPCPVGVSPAVMS